MFMQLFLLPLSLIAQTAQASNPTKTITCSSWNKGYSECYVGPVAHAKIKNQLSKASCGHNWGYTHDSIWVNHGCRAEFKVELVYDASADTQDKLIKCESKDYYPQQCPIGHRHVISVDLQKRLSDTSCDGKWGYDQSSIWVDHGCRGLFRVVVGNEHPHIQNQTDHRHYQGHHQFQRKDYHPHAWPQTWYPW